MQRYCNILQIQWKRNLYEAILGNPIFFPKYTMCDKWSAHANPSVLSRLLNTKNQPPYINKTNKRENATFLIFMQNNCLPKKSWTEDVPFKSPSVPLQTTIKIIISEQNWRKSSETTRHLPRRDFQMPYHMDVTTLEYLEV